MVRLSNESFKGAFQTDIDPANCMRFDVGYRPIAVEAGPDNFTVFSWSVLLNVDKKMQALLACFQQVLSP